MVKMFFGNFDYTVTNQRHAVEGGKTNTKGKDSTLQYLSACKSRVESAVDVHPNLSLSFLQVS